MHKPDSSVPTIFVGIDVGARELTVTVQADNKLQPVRTFANTTAGHQQLRRYLGEHGQRMRVCLEASGNYSLDLCLMRSPKQKGPALRAGP